MKKVCLFLTAAALCVSMTSCLSSLPTTSITPVATNTINTVSFSELNLSREDYKILNTIEVSSVVTVNYQDNSNSTIIKITDDGGYSVELEKNKYSNIIMSSKSSGVLRAGFLTNDYSDVDYNNPEAIARATAFSRLVGMAKEVGGDALIEPIVATNLEEKSTKNPKDKSRTFVYHTTASAKVVVIKADK